MNAFTIDVHRYAPNEFWYLLIFSWRALHILFYRRVETRRYKCDAPLGLEYHCQLDCYYRSGHCEHCALKMDIDGEGIHLPGLPAGTKARKAGLILTLNQRTSLRAK